jgi:hypothetical protein
VKETRTNERTNERMRTTSKKKEMRTFWMGFPFINQLIN